MDLPIKIVNAEDFKQFSEKGLLFNVRKAL